MLHSMCRDICPGTRMHHSCRLMHSQVNLLLLPAAVTPCSSSTLQMLCCTTDSMRSTVGSQLAVSSSGCPAATKQGQSLIELYAVTARGSTLGTA